MPNDIDKSLLDRLQALRGNDAEPEQTAQAKVEIDLIERKKTPSREDALTARLKSLRSHHDEKSSPPSRESPQMKPNMLKFSGTNEETLKKKKPQLAGGGGGDDDDDAADAIFETDDQTLEELLRDVATDDEFAAEPDEAKVKALLEELSDSVPQEEATAQKSDEKNKDSDDSDGEEMSREVEDVLDRLRDEAEIEAALERNSPGKKPLLEDQASPDADDVALPAVPSDLQDLLPSAPSARRAGSADLDDIMVRMAALRAPKDKDVDDDGLTLPSVPTSKPSGGPVKRLTTKTGYTDDDMDSWCTVCLEDATLRCLGCDDDVYCTRCWREMHIGPSAAFDERSHKAVQFTRDRKKEEKIALGA